MQQLALEFSTFPFPYQIVRSRRKTLVIYVKSGKVEVRAPLRASEKWITTFLTEKSPWIKAQLASQKQRRQEKLVIAEGSKIHFRGETLTIQVAIARTAKAVRHGSTLTLFVREPAKDKLEKTFREWLLQQAKAYMPAMTRHYARELGLEHKLKAVTFRLTKTKWGHCCQDGTIQFNWMVMLAPQAVLDYLIAHETSHLRYLNHSSRFWNTVESLCPDYRELRDWLTDNGHRLWT
jgi:predicted metal-dependent hydrolase